METSTSFFMEQTPDGFTLLLPESSKTDDCLKSLKTLLETHNQAFHAYRFLSVGFIQNHISPTAFKKYFRPYLPCEVSYFAIIGKGTIPCSLRTEICRVYAENE